MPKGESAKIFVKLITAPGIDCQHFKMSPSVNISFSIKFLKDICKISYDFGSADKDLHAYLKLFKISGRYLHISFFFINHLECHLGFQIHTRVTEFLIYSIDFFFLL